MFDWEADADRKKAHAGGYAQLASSINLYNVSRLPRNKPIRKLNLYLGFTPVKRANPIRLAVSLRDLQAPTGYLTRPMTQPKWRMSLRRIFPIAAIALFKAWIPFCANEW